MTEPKSIVEYGKRCLLCRNDAAASRVLCWRHIDEIRDMLDVRNVGSAEHGIPASIPVLFAALDAFPSGSGPIERRAPGFESSPPGSLHVMALRDPRSLPAEWDNVRSVPGTLARIIDAVCEELVYTSGGAGATVDSACRWLGNRLEPLSRLPWADDLYRDLRELSDSLRAVFGDTPPKPIGRCTNVIVVVGSGADIGNHHNAVCGSALYPPPRRAGDVEPREVPAIECSRCHAIYDGLAQIRLEAQQRDEEP